VHVRLLLAALRWVDRVVGGWHEIGGIQLFEDYGTATLYVDN